VDFASGTRSAAAGGITTVFDHPLGEPPVTTAERGLTLAQFVRLSSTNVARWLGLYPRKGTLRPGSDADLAVYARDVSDVIRAEALLCKQKWTPYDGRQVSFRLEACMLRGAWVYSGGAIQGGPTGQFIPSGPAARHAGSAAPGVPA
jgi:dihydroorotase-like cyclic amidohydrolase